MRPADGLSGLPGVHDLRSDGEMVAFDVDSDQLDGVVRHLSGLGLRSLTSHPPTLEELFLRHYGDELADNGDGADDGAAGDERKGWLRRRRTSR
jgi:ABC-2 type transport system ATP-binding protein